MAVNAVHIVHLLGGDRIEITKTGRLNWFGISIRFFLIRNAGQCEERLFEFLCFEINKSGQYWTLYSAGDERLSATDKLYSTLVDRE